MRLIAALILLLLAPASPGQAQSADAKAKSAKAKSTKDWDTKAWDTKAAAKKGAAPVARPAVRSGGRTACPEYGAGFYRLEGSDTCIRIGGGVGLDVGISNMR